ncbi:hypothetical protein U1Q18_002584, partial [Sarracenia purpurea var. burkii]
MQSNPGTASRNQNTWQNLQEYKANAEDMGQDDLVVEARELNEAWFKSCAIGIMNESIKVESIQPAMESE